MAPGPKEPELTAQASTGAVSLRRRAVLGAIIAAAMTVLDLAVTSTALGSIQESLGTSLDRGALVISAYATAELVTLLLSAYLTRVLRPRLYLALLVGLFVLGSVLTASAWSFESLLVARVVQGAAAGAIMPFAYYAIVVLVPAAEQPRAISVFSLTVTASYVLGPILSLTLGEWFTWRALYLVAAPIGLVALWLALPGLRHMPAVPARAGRRVSLVSFGAAVVGLFLIQFLLDAGGERGWFASALVTGLAVVAVGAFAVFVTNELRTRSPLVDLRLLRQVPFMLSCAFNVVAGSAVYSSYFLIPYALTTLDYTVGDIGAVSLYGAVVQLGVAFFLPLLLRRVDVYLVSLAGSSIFAVAALVPLLAGPAPGGVAVIVALVARAVGAGLLLASLGLMMTRALQASDAASGSLLFNLARSLGGSIGAAACAAFLVLRQAQYATAAPVGDLASRTAALHDTYLVASVVLGALSVVFLTGYLRRRTADGVRDVR